MKTLASAAAVTALAFAATGAEAQSAKFAANWSEDAVLMVPVVEVANFDSPTRMFSASEKVATIKAAQGKEMLVGLSGIVTLSTWTEATGSSKNGGGKSNSTAEAMMQVEIKYVDAGGGNPCGGSGGYTAAPGKVTFASRRQELNVGVVVSQEGTVVTDDSLQVDVTVELGIDTTAAHHFNFVAYDMNSGEYDFYACYTFSEDEMGDIGSNQSAAVAIGKRVIAVQEVRAVKTGETIDTTGGKI